jgi:hypothetical protein
VFGNPGTTGTGITGTRTGITGTTGTTGFSGTTSHAKLQWAQNNTTKSTTQTQINICVY